MALADAVPFAVAHWALDEASGTRFDSIGSSDLTDENTVGSAAGKFGNAADFTPDGESLNRADNAALSSGDVKFLVRAWVYLESFDQGYGGIIGKVSAGAAIEYLLLYRTSTSRFEWQYGSATVSANNFGAASTGTWYLIHAWHDPDANEIAISVNAGTPDTASLSGGNSDTAHGFAVGNLGEFRDGNSTWDGRIDDVVILKDYLLDATERTADYNSGAGLAFEDWDVGGGGNRRRRLLCGAAA